MRTTRTIVTLVAVLCAATMMRTGVASAQSLVDIEGDEPEIELSDDGGSGSDGMKVVTDQGAVGSSGVVDGDTEDGLSIDLDGEGNQGDREGSADIGTETFPDGEVSASANPLLVTEQVSVGDDFLDEVQLDASPDDAVPGKASGTGQNE